MHRQIAGKLTGKVTKWLVLGFWILVMVGASGLAQKLADVQNNEASSWLPADAESTRALERMEPFQDPNSIPTLVLYERESGLTQQDMAAANEHAAEFEKIDGVEGKVLGPFPSEDGQAMQTVVTFNFGKNGWLEMPETADTLREIAA